MPIRINRTRRVCAAVGLRARLVVCVLCASTLLGGCGDGPVESRRTADASLARGGKLLEIRLDVDLAEGTVSETVLSSRLPPGRPASTRFPLLNMNVTSLLRALDTASCITCGDGVQGAHEISIPLQNKSTTLWLDIDSVQSWCEGCDGNITENPAANVLLGRKGNAVDSAQTIPVKKDNYRQHLTVFATEDQFSVWFNVWGAQVSPP